MSVWRKQTLEIRIIYLLNTTLGNFDVMYDFILLI